MKHEYCIFPIFYSLVVARTRKSNISHSLSAKDIYPSFFGNFPLMSGGKTKFVIILFINYPQLFIYHLQINKKKSNTVSTFLQALSNKVRQGQWKLISNWKTLTRNVQIRPNNWRIKRASPREKRRCKVSHFGHLFVVYISSLNMHVCSFAKAMQSCLCEIAKET